MKTLKGNNEIKRLPDSNEKERKVIEKLILEGWKYVPKNEWKKETRIEKVQKVEKSELTEVKEGKKIKERKNKKTSN